MGHCKPFSFCRSVLLEAILTKKSSAPQLLHKTDKSVTPADTIVKSVEMRRYRGNYRMLAVRTFCRDHHPMYRILFHSYDISKECSVHSPALRSRFSRLRVGAGRPNKPPPRRSNDLDKRGRRKSAAMTRPFRLPYIRPNHALTQALCSGSNICRTARLHPSEAVFQPGSRESVLYLRARF